jgi:DNA-directed RNA polymerase specialized sigma24 family protein
MKKDWDLTQDDFDRLLLWLHPDREQAALKYEKIQVRLIKIFVGRGCGDDAEHLADRTIDRVSRKLEAGEVPEPYIGDQAVYFHSFVNNICHEHFRERKPREIPPPVDPPDEIEEEHAYLERCMATLEEEDRSLVIEYYRFEKAAKIEHRGRLAMQLGIDVKALRLRVYRLRVRLRRCIEDCRAQSPSH